MSLRTRRGLALWASIFLVASACTQGPAASPAATTPAPPTATEPTATEPTATEPTATEPTATEPTATEPTATEPTATEPTATEPTGTEPPATDVDSLLYGSEYAPTEGTPGGTVVIADWQIPDQLNYYYSNAFVNSQVIIATMRGLWTVSHDGKWVTDLAVTVPRISDQTIRIGDAKGECPEDAQQGDTPAFEIDLDIKPGLVWSDGETLDLNDLRYTWEWILDPDQVGLVAGTDGYDLITDFTVADDGLSATVAFCTGYAGVLGLLAQPPLPEHYMSEIPVVDAAQTSYPVGPASVDAPVSGPFQYSSLSPSAIELTRNENYNSCVGDGCTPHPAYLERVIYRFFDGAKDAMIAAAINGELDVATDLLQFDVPALEGQVPPSHELQVEVAWEMEHFDFNQSGRGPGQGHPALTDPNVRLALAQAIDKDALYQAVSPGATPPEDEPCSPTPPGLYFRSTEGLTCIEYDPAAAAAALDAAGWTDTDGDGIRDKDGESLTLLHCHTGAGFRVTAGDFIAAAFQEIGVELLNTPAPETVFAGWNEVPADAECNLSHGNYDTAEFAWVNTFDLLGDYYGYHSSRIPTDENGGEGNNYIRLENPEMDAALDSLFGLTDPADQIAVAGDVQRIHTEIQAETVLYYRSSARVVNANLENFAKNPGTFSDMWNIEDWYLAGG